MSAPRFKPYPAYKESGVGWLGEIPAHWESVRMWRISRAMSGGTPAREETAYWDGEIPWVSPKDMKRRVIDSSQDTITKRAIEETGIKLISPPVVLIVVRGMILAHTFPVAITAVPVTINQDMKALTFADTIEPVFMVWLFEGVGKQMLAAIVEEAAHGTRAIRMDEWRSVTVTVPPVAEQRAIATFLDRETARIDGLVAKKERLIELLQEKRTALITRAVTKGLDPNVTMKDSGVEWLGEVPAHWKVLKTTWLFSIGSGTTPTSEDPAYYGGETPWITTSELRESVVVATAKNVTEVALREHSSLKVHPKGSVAVAMYGATIGRLGILGTAAAVNQACCVFSNPTGIETQFWFYWLQMRRSYLISLGYGGGQPNLSQDLLRAMRVPTPLLTEQRTIVEFLDRETARIDALVAKVREAIDRLKELRTALISAAVTGKIDVRTASAVAQTRQKGGAT
jgi:type I restriction enzyme, S subunit